MTHLARLPQSVTALAALLCMAATRHPLPPAAPTQGIPADAQRAGTTSRDPLDAAFRFATAIEADPNDQAMAQAEVVTELIALGRLEEASRRAAKIKNWRQGASYANIAHAWAEQGRPERARECVDKAEAVRRATSDWGGPRIAAHMAQALAALGDVERTTALAQDLVRGDPREYGGRAAAAIAAGLVQTGDFTGAMERLKALDQERDFDVAWWRTTGYLDLARRPDLAAGDRAEALRAARRSADGVAGWKRGEALVNIGRESARRGNAPAAHEALEAAERVIAPLPPTMPTKVALMSGLASAWDHFGDKARGRQLLQRAESEASAAVVIDRPGAWAAVAGSRWSIGDHAAARTLYDRALSEAEKLVNARPRALSVVEICRSFGRNRVTLGPEVHARLDALFAGLRDPW